MYIELYWVVLVLALRFHDATYKCAAIVQTENAIVIPNDISDYFI